MPGLFGILSKDPTMSTERLGAMGYRMAATMRTVPWMKAEIWADSSLCAGRVHLGIVSPKGQPLVTQDRRTVLWLDGELHRTQPADSGLEESAEQLRELLEEGQPGLSRANGVFNLVSFDTISRELSLANDRLGLRPLYTIETPTFFAYAGEVKALLTVLEKMPEIDEISLQQFLSFDHMLGDRTWWQGVRALPPGSSWKVSVGGRHSTRRYWTFAAIQRNLSDPSDVQDELGRLWAADVGRHSREGRTPLLLSGGQDSRALLAELRTQGREVVAITHGSSDCPDVRIARQVTAAAGVKHIVNELTLVNWWYGRDEVIWHTDGMINALHLHSAIDADAVHQGNSYSPVNIAGDLLFGGSHLRGDAVATWPDSAVDLVGRRYHENPFFSQEEALAVSSDDIQSYVEGPSPDCFSMLQFLRRFTIAGPSCLAAHGEMVYVGISAPILDLIMGSLRDEDRRSHRFYNRFLVDRYPAYYADLPWQTTGRGLSESGVVRVKRGARRRLRRVFGAGEHKRPPEQWFVDYPRCIREGRVREKLCAEELMLDGYLDGRVRRTLSAVDNPLLTTRLVLNILTAETYLRQVAGMPGLVESPRDSAAVHPG